MLRILQAFLFLGIWSAAGAAAAQGFSGEFEAEAEPMGDEVSAESDNDDLRAELDALRAEVEALKQQQDKKQEAEASEDGESDSEETSDAEASKEKTKGGLKLGGVIGDWETGATGYFRAPMIMSLSNRRGPDDDSSAEPQAQLAYGPNRLMDSNYYSFAYTRLQEQDWVQLSIYARRKHVDAEVGWMGYWLQSAGYRNPDAGWAPAIARLTLDWDVPVRGRRFMNVALTGGAWWPKFGYHEKYDTYTLGQFRHLGEQLRFTFFLPADFKLTFYQGFGSSRDGNYEWGASNAPALYRSKTGLDLMHYEHLRLAYRDIVEVGFHYSNQFTRDPRKYEGSSTISYDFAKEAKMSVLGGELKANIPRGGSLWLSPSYIKMKNGVALAEGGTEVMHGLGGAGVAVNYMGFSDTAIDYTTGTGSMFNLGFMYENSLSSILGKERGSMFPDVTASIFGLLASAKPELEPLTETMSAQYRPQDSIKQFKWGVDAELHALKFLGVMVRYDSVNYDLDHPGYVFSAITGRLSFSSHFLSGERIYFQYSHYKYGDHMVLRGTWPWTQPLIAGSNYYHDPAYEQMPPDRDVFKIQAEIDF